MAMESGDFSQDADFLSTSLPANDEYSVSGKVGDLHIITFLERLEIEDFETAPSYSEADSRPGGRPSEAWMLRRIEPVGPVDYLEYHRRMN